MRQKSAYACVETTHLTVVEPCGKIHGVVTFEVSGPLHSLFDHIDEDDVRLLSEDQAYELFLRARWPAAGEQPTCPKCGDAAPYAIRRRSFKCSVAECRREFSATTGTVFNSRKLSFKKIVIALFEQSLTRGRLPPGRLGGMIQVSYGTAHGLRKRLESVAAHGVLITNAGGVIAR